MCTPRNYIICFIGICRKLYFVLVLLKKSNMLYHFKFWTTKEKTLLWPSTRGRQMMMYNDADSDINPSEGFQTIKV